MLSIIISVYIIVLTVPSYLFASDDPPLLPKLGLGTAALGAGSIETVVSALKLGVRLLDTAQAKEWYNEANVGRALYEYISSTGDDNILDNVIIVTKIHPRSFEFNTMVQAIHNSFQELKVSTIHAVLLHAPYCWPNSCTHEQESVSWQTGWKNLQTISKMYNIKAIGVSNFDIRLLEEAFNMPTKYKAAEDDKFLSHIYKRVSIIQNWMDPFHQDKEVRKFAKEHSIQYMAYSSMGTQWHEESSGNPVLNNPVLQSIANKHNVSIPQVVLSWLVKYEGVIAIPRATKLTHLQDNFVHTLPKRYLISEDNYGINDNNHSDFDNNNDDTIELDENDVERIRALDGTRGNPWD
eukprot:gene11351-15219_t